MSQNHWTLTQDEHHIAWLILDRADSKVNALNAEVMTELAQKIDEVNQDSRIIGLVFRSAKPGHFIVGADIHTFQDHSNEAQVLEMVLKGQAIFNKIAELNIPTVVLIHGPCLGGGYELALACRYRVALDDPSTRIGLPEILLGIHPGWGGTVRLPEKTGLATAVDLILTGKALNAKRAKKAGVVDYAVPERHFERAAVELILKPPRAKQLTLMQKIPALPLIKPIIFNKVRKTLAKKARIEHYPAPYAVLDLMQRPAAYDSDQLRKEAHSMSKLLLTSTSKNLQRVFKLQTSLKGLPAAQDFKIQHVHVIGPGAMGAGIATWAALKGCHVTLQGIDLSSLAEAKKHAVSVFAKHRKEKHQYTATLDRFVLDPNGEGIKHADLIIEAIFENLDIKQKIFKELEQKSKENAILATNTSSISLDEINQVLERPERLIGIHFFNPVEQMQLVEIVIGDKTDIEIVKKATAFVQQISKLPLPVKSHPGFLVNRVLMPYLYESVELLSEGIAAERIDEAALRFGMPLGPVELADTVGLDICCSVAKNLTRHFGGEVPSVLVEKCEQGQWGRKTGQGFYAWQKNKPQKKSTVEQSDISYEEIADRLVLRMINEAAACLRDKVVVSADLCDAGMIFGTGFAPFRGGPLNYARSFAFSDLKAKFSAFETRYGERFRSDPGLQLIYENEEKNAKIKNN